MNKVLVIGLDGATWDLIKPWVNEGKLPTFKKIMNEGVYGDLKSTIPCISAPAWTSAFTGVNPGKHNLFDFVTNEGYEKKVVTSRSRRRKAIWNTLSIQDKKVIVINVPLTYPPEKVNGIMISGWGTPDIKSDFTYPKELKEDLIKENYAPFYEVKGEFAQDAEKDYYIKRVIKLIEQREDISLKLLKTHDWDLFIVVFISLMRIQYFFWKYINSTGEDAEKYADTILNIYKKADNTLEKFLNNVDKNTNIIIFSDHGFGSIYKDIYLNNALRDLDLIEVTEKTKNEVLRKMGLTRENIAKKIPSRLLAMIPKKLQPFGEGIPSESGLEDIEWSKTKVWLFSYSGRSLIINLKNRELNGIIDENNYDEFRDFITNYMYELKDPETREKIIEKVYRREEIYQGPYVENAPDLIIEPSEGYFLRGGFGEKMIMPSKQAAQHKQDGIFLAYGPDIEKGKEIKGSKIIDITPTIMQIFNIPIPKDMDGRVMKEIFKEDSVLTKRTTIYQDTSDKEMIKESIQKLKRTGKL